MLTTKKPKAKSIIRINNTFQKFLTFRLRWGIDFVENSADFEQSSAVI